MITILRKIRRSLLQSGDTKKYTFYALGEILLVVIGILLALQINNWNEKRIEQSVEKEYLTILREQLGEDQEVLGNERNYNRSLIEKFNYAKTIIRNDQRDLKDTLGRIAMNLTDYADFRRRSNVFQTLVTSGEIRLIKNPELMGQLQSLEQLYNYINRLESSHGDVIISHMVVQISKTIRVDPFNIEKPDILYGYEFENNFSLLIDLMMEQESLYDQALEDINSILQNNIPKP